MWLILADIISRNLVYAFKTVNFSMLDISDFVTERGGDPNSIRENQKRRFAPIEVVDKILRCYEDHRQGKR